MVSTFAPLLTDVVLVIAGWSAVGKEVTSVSVDSDLKKQLEDDPEVNVSGLFNQFLREYYDSGTADGLDARIRELDRRIEEKERKIERLEDDVERLRDERDDLQERKEQREERQDPKVEEAVSTLASIDDGKLSPDNPAVRNHANDLNMAPDALCERVREAKGDGSV